MCAKSSILRDVSVEKTLLPYFGQLITTLRTDLHEICILNKRGFKKMENLQKTVYKMLQNYPMSVFSFASD